MKKLYNLCFILVLLLLLIGCQIPDSEPITTEWSISGDATMIGVPTYSVKLAAFYGGSDRFGSAANPMLVSNIADLGLSGDMFSLYIDASSLSPIAGHYIELIMWQDANNNDLFEDIENWVNTCPLAGCPVFQEAFFCDYYYDDTTNALMGTQKGWNQAIDFAEYLPIDQAVKTGARIENILTWL